jgi:hypothetical protein
MLSDPRIGRAVALSVTTLALLWLLAIAVASDAIYARLGMGMHPITFLAIFAALAGGAVAALFQRFATVKAELAQGLRVLGRWSVDRATFATVAPAALAADDADKRGVLRVILAFVAVIFGAVALIDPDVALVMMAVAAGLAAIVGLAFWLGRRTMRRHWVWRGGEAVVGERGLVFNGVLHVWDAPLTQLRGARVSASPPALVVAYRYWSRAGAQGIETVIPVPRGAMAEARAVADRLNAAAR